MDYSVIVLGAGHAGVEAALASARMGQKTLCLTLNMDAVALMACNPAVGGTSKGQLVAEIDALGGEMGICADESFLQMRMLNTGKGASVRSLRAQVDKIGYQQRMKLALESAENLQLLQGECVSIKTHGGKVSGIVCADGTELSCRALIIACGVYLKSRVLIGDYARESGPSGLLGAYSLSGALTSLGFELRRFKTGTPPRIDGKSIDREKMLPQYGDVPAPAFSKLHGSLRGEQLPCYLTYTNSETHRIILENISRSAMYNGLVNATGTRYCPSIEDKLMRFKDKDRHQLFIEPEGLNTRELYVQGMSTSLPAEVQLAMLRTVEGLEHCSITRMGYAIEYDCIDPTALTPALCSHAIDNLFFAGQINGSSGYEEAAAQGIIAGINAALMLRSEEPFILTRADAYIGVLLDDLSVKGTNEPYRMMTSRAEYRLLLRQDNADMRLTEKARRTGLISDERYSTFMRKSAEVQKLRKALEKVVPPSEELSALLAEKGSADIKSGIRLFDLLKRAELSVSDLFRLFSDVLPSVQDDAAYEVELSSKYEGYIKKQNDAIDEFKKYEQLVIPAELDYNELHGLRIEARQKLSKHRPVSVGQASRISGVSPADIAVLLVALKSINA